MIKDRVTAEEVKRAITGRISAGVYVSGSALPPLRQMAEELGANRNTVNKACRALQELGILEMPPGRKSFVVGKVPQASGTIEHVRHQARDAVWQAMAAGVPREHLLGELSLIVNEVYGAGDIRIRFLECNQYDSEALGAELTRLVGAPVVPGLLDELTTDAEGLVRSHDLVVTTFHHLADVTRALAAVEEKVVGVDTRLSPETLLSIARMTASRVGLICSIANTAQTLRHTVSSYHPGWSIETALIGDPAAVEHLARSCDRLIVTHNCADAVAALTRRQPDVVIEFRIDQQSIAYLRERIRAVRLGRTVLSTAAVGQAQRA